MATPADVIASARVLTDQVGSTQAGTDAELTAWMEEDYPELVRELVRIVPKWFTESTTVVPASVTPGSGDSRFMQVIRVERIMGDNYVLVPQADDNSTSTPDRVCWRQVGADLEILPITQSFTDTFKVYFIAEAELPASGDPLKLPTGMHHVLVRRLACRMCERLNLSTTTHENAITRIMEKAKTSLAPTTSAPGTISDYSQDDGW